MAKKLFPLTILFIINILTFFNACGADKLPEKSIVKIRQARAAGTFYPDSRNILDKTVNSLLDEAQKINNSGIICAATAPHAGYVFSGRIAACTFKNIRDMDFETIIIIGHDSYQDAVAYTCPVDYFETPMGKIKVDTEIVEKLHEFNRGIKPAASIHSTDHTIEVQLPFIQAIKKECKIVPLLFGLPSPENCRILADAIKHASENKKIFVLASTDMSHYPTWEDANKMDSLTLDAVKSMDINRFFKHVYTQMKTPELPGLRTAICASGGVGTAMLLAKDMGAETAEVLKYANSGDVTGGDKKRVVGYSSVLFIKK